MRDQIAWLDYQAKVRGWKSLNGLPIPVFFTLAAMWRLAHPVAGT